MHHFDHQYPACQRQLLRERLLISHGQVTSHRCHAQQSIQSIRFTSFYRLMSCQSAEAPQDFHRIALAHHHETSEKKRSTTARTVIHPTSRPSRPPWCTFASPGTHLGHGEGVGGDGTQGGIHPVPTPLQVVLWSCTGFFVSIQLAEVSLLDYLDHGNCASTATHVQLFCIQHLRPSSYKDGAEGSLLG